MPEQRRELQQRRLRQLVDRLLAAGGLQAARLRDAGVRRGGDVSHRRSARLPTVTKRISGTTTRTGCGRRRWRTSSVCTGPRGPVGGRRSCRTPPLTSTSGRRSWLVRSVARARLGAAWSTTPTATGCSPGGLGVHHGAMRLGATVLPLSGGMTDRQIRHDHDLRPDILTCTPSYAIFLGEALRRRASSRPACVPGVFGAEPWTNEMRAQIERLLGLRALDIYGLSEIIGPGVAARVARLATGC